MIELENPRKPPLPYTPNDYLTGRVSMPPWFRYKQQRFYVQAFQNILTAAVASNEVTLDGDSFFLLEGINIVTVPSEDNSVTLNVQFSDTSKGQPWSIGNLVFRNTTGRGDTTKYFTQPTLLRPSTSIIFSTNNTTAQPVYGSLIGRKVYGLTEAEARFLLRRMWYQYDILITAIPPSATDTFNVLTYADSDFHLWKMFCSRGIFFTNSEIAAGNAPSELMVTLKDATSNRSLMNKPVPIRLIAGSMIPTQNGGTTPDVVTLGDGFKLPIPFFVKRNSTLLLEVTNQNSIDDLSGPTNFTLEGCRVFD